MDKPFHHDLLGVHITVWEWGKKCEAIYLREIERWAAKLQDRTIIAVIRKKAMSAPAVPRSAEIRSHREEISRRTPWRSC